MVGILLNISDEWTDLGSRLPAGPGLGAVPGGTPHPSSSIITVLMEAGSERDGDQEGRPWRGLIGLGTGGGGLPYSE